MNPRPEPRIGDAERDAAIRALGEHYAAGRIGKEEFDERSEVAMRARTDSDLRPLFLDLPPLYVGPTPTTAPRGRPAAPGSWTPWGPAWPHAGWGPQPSWGPAHHARPGHSRPAWQSLPLLPIVTVLVVVAVLSGAWWLLFVVWLLFACRPRRHRRPY